MKNFQSHYTALKSLLQNEDGLTKMRFGKGMKGS